MKLALFDWMGIIYVRTESADGLVKWKIQDSTKELTPHRSMIIEHLFRKYPNYELKQNGGGE